MLATSAVLGVVAGLVPVLLASPTPADVSARGGRINVIDACHQQYGSQWKAASSGQGANDWYCTNPANGNTGKLDFEAYCKKTYGSGSKSRNDGSGLNGWSCT